DQGLSARLAAGRHLWRADRARYDDLLRLRLPDRAEGIRRRHLRRHGELSGDGAGRHPGRPAGELRVVLEQRLQGSRRVRPADPHPAVALAQPGRGRGGRGRGMSPFQLRLAGFAAVVLLALAPALLSAFSITLMNFIGIYAIAVLGLVLLTGIGG